MHPYANAISLAQNLHKKYSIRIAAVEVIIAFGWKLDHHPAPHIGYSFDL